MMMKKDSRGFNFHPCIQNIEEVYKNYPMLKNHLGDSETVRVNKAIYSDSILTISGENHPLTDSKTKIKGKKSQKLFVVFDNGETYNWHFNGQNITAFIESTKSMGRVVEIVIISRIDWEFNKKPCYYSVLTCKIPIGVYM